MRYEVSLRHLLVPVVTVSLSGSMLVSGQEIAFQLLLSTESGTRHPGDAQAEPCLGPHGHTLSHLCVAAVFGFKAGHQC